jgi:hypothetical protein
MANELRAQRALIACQAYIDAKCERMDDDSAHDLLADLLHLLREQQGPGFNAQATLDRALMHYEAEVG